MIRGRTLRTETLDRDDVRNVKRSAYVSGSGRQSCEPEFNFKDARHRAQKWNVGPEYRNGL